MSEFEVLCFGETMALLVAEQTGDLAAVELFRKRIAGADSNVAIGLARLGFDVAWLSRVGGDALGRFVIASLEREGLDCSHVAMDARYPTGIQFKARVDDGSDPAVEYFRKGSAASHLSTADLSARLLAASHVHATGIPPALSAETHALSRHVMQEMRSRGRSVSFDPNLRPSLWPSQAQMITSINALAAQADWVLPGLAEGRLLSGYHTPEDIAAFYLDQGSEMVAIKLGAGGAFYRTAHEQGLITGFTVPRVVDTVGAGDGFAVGVISALLEACPVADAVTRGNWIGSRAVQTQGDMEGLPTRAELEAAGIDGGLPR